MNDQQHRRVGAGGCAAAWTTDRLDAREKLERPLARADWPALTAFSIVGLFHQKQRGVKVVMMIDQNDDRLGRRRAPHQCLSLIAVGSAVTGSDRQRGLMSCAKRNIWSPP